MFVLVLNCGSSSLKAAVLDPRTGHRRASAHVERIGAGGPTGHREALATTLPELLAGGPVAAVGHRVVHGGERFTAPTRLDGPVLEAIRGLIPLAPLHLPANLAGIEAATALLPDLPQFGVFDTAFHATLPARSRTYALPRDVAATHGIRRYGFHGTSHAWVARRAADHLGEDLGALRLITCHLGSGASICAIEYGRSIDTSMGMTPLEGVAMGTRAGDIDAGALLHLLRSGYDVDGLDELLNRRSGLAGLSGVGNDLRDIEARAAQGDEACRAAIAVFAHRVRKYLGAYAAVLGGVDAIVFTAGIGENSAAMRHRIAQRLEFLGARIDEDANRAVSLSPEHPVAVFSDPHARCRLLAVRTDEEAAIARDVLALLGGDDEVPAGDAIPIAVSARHVHLTAADVGVLFGEGHRLTPKKWLSQPGQFACEERVTLIGPRGRIERVGVIGPVRRAAQVEVSRTDEFLLGVDAPIRASGQLDGSPGLTLEGPAGTLTIPRGVIQAERHIHMRPEDAERFGVSDGDKVEVAIDSEGRDLIFGDVLIRVSAASALEMHVDTDEANAANITPGLQGILAATSATVHLRRKALRPA